MDNEEAIRILKEIIEEGWLISDLDKHPVIEACELAIEALLKLDKVEKLLKVGVLKDCESCKAQRKEFRHFTFWELVKCLRESKEWTQRELSMRSGISNAEISRIETGKRKDPGIRSSR